MTSIVADAANPDSYDLPAVVIFDLGNGDVEAVLHPAGDGLQDAAFALKVVILWQTEAYLACSNVHFHSL